MVCKFRHSRSLYGLCFFYVVLLLCTQHGFNRQKDWRPLNLLLMLVCFINLFEWS